VISNQSIEQTVRLRENETGILAGFLQTQLSNAITGTPGLGEIPLGNYLAANQDLQRDESEVLILITPRLVRLENHEARRIYAGQGALDNGAAAPTPLGGSGNPGRFNPTGAPANALQPGQPEQPAAPPAANEQPPANNPPASPNTEAPRANAPTGNEPTGQAPAPVITPMVQPPPNSTRPQ
jgi:hypothetical protein